MVLVLCLCFRNINTRHVLASVVGKCLWVVGLGWVGLGWFGVGRSETICGHCKGQTSAAGLSGLFLEYGFVLVRLFRCTPFGDVFVHVCHSSFGMCVCAFRRVVLVYHRWSGLFRYQLFRYQSRTNSHHYSHTRFCIPWPIVAIVDGRVLPCVRSLVVFFATCLGNIVARPHIDDDVGCFRYHVQDGPFGSGGLLWRGCRWRT